MAATAVSPDAALPPPAATPVDWAASDAAWERVVTVLQTLVANISCQFEALSMNNQTLEDDRMTDAPQSLASSVVSSFQSAPVYADIGVVHRAGDGDLLDEIALDLVLDSLKQKIIPRFWASISSVEGISGGDVGVSQGWQGRLRHGVNALLQLYTAHITLINMLRASQTSGRQPENLYRASFRVAVQENWPSGFADALQHFFRHTWQHSASQARSRRRECRQQRGTKELECDSDEWWCEPVQGQPAPRGPAERVLLLLDPARRPLLLAGADEAMVDSRPSMVQSESEPWQPDAAWTADDDCDTSLTADSSGEEDAISFPSAHLGDLSLGLREVSEALMMMGLQDIWRDHVMGFAIEEVTATVQDRCRGEFDVKGLLQRLTAWLYDPVLRWLRTAFGLAPVASGKLLKSDSVSASGVEADRSLEAEDAWWTSARRVVLQFFEIFVEVRILEAFDMVRDFPESIPALLDLRRCLARTGRTAPLVKALRQQLTRRLLIAGAHTRDVIKVYIKTIKAMRLVDPRGLLLEAVSAPIRAYLKRRKDTVRCIVTALTEDSDLQLELHTGAEAVRQATSNANATSSSATASSSTTAARATVPPNNTGAAPANNAGAPPNNAGAPPNNAGAPPNNAGATQPPPPPPVEHPGLSLGNVDHEASEEEEDPDSWMPDPIDADPWQPSRQRRAQDVISLLVGIYGSKEMFIKEYKEMLADRLLGMNSYGTERETQNLELLKTRFGEAALGHCEVMLQDIKDSKRINGNIQQSVKSQQTAADATASTVASFRPQSRGTANAASAAGTAERPFMTPFSLSGIFGLCLQTPQGSAGASGQGASMAIPSEHAGDPAFPAASGLVPPQSEDPRLALEQMQALVLSRHYWPSAFAKEDHPNFKLPAVLEDALAEYSRSYTQIRAKRNLSWHRAHGLVEITVQLADRSLANVMVTPVHLAVLACFQDDSNDAEVPDASGAAGGSLPSNSNAHSPSRCLSLQEVASKLELPEALVRKRIQYWVSKGVLREVRAGYFDVQESLSTVEGVGARGGSHLDDDVEHSPGTTAARAGPGGGRDAPCAAEQKACEAFAQAMLTNYTSLPLGRIHNFLQMFMMDPPYTHTEAQLRDFLSRLCQEGKLEFNGSNYALVKESNRCQTTQAVPV